MKTDNQIWQITFEQLPTTLDLLRALPQADLQEPQDAAALLIPALCLWPTNQITALEMISFLKGPQALSVREIQFINERLRGKAYLPFSYFEGTSPEKGYVLSGPYKVTIFSLSNSFDESSYAKLYLKSTGADSLRPVQLRKMESSGEWFLWEQMLLSDIRPSVSEDPWL